MNTDTLSREITANSARFDRFLSFLPNPAELFTPGGADLAYREMLLDAHLSAKLSRLKDDVLFRPWSIAAAAQEGRELEAAEAVRRMLADIDVSAILTHLMTAVEYGYSVAEVVWEFSGGWWRPDAVIARPASRFRFDADGTPVMLAASGAVRLDEPYKCLIHRHDPQAENPYGSPVLAKCYWPWQFKKAGLRFWLTAVEKYGVPTVMALFSAGDDAEGRERAQDIAEALAGIQNDAALALANVDDVKTLESRGTAADFRELIELCNQEMSKAVTGEVLTSDIGATGSYALAQEHGRTLASRTKRLAAAVSGTMSTLAAWACRLNFGESVRPPRFVIDMSDTPPWDTVKDAIDRGVPVSRSALYAMYNIPEPESDDDAFTA